MNTGQRLKALRESKGLSQEEVAKIIGVGRTTYLKYESGENKPTRKLQELSQLFNVDANYILCMDSNTQDEKMPQDMKKYLEQSEVIFDGDVYHLDDEGREMVRQALKMAFLAAKEANKRKKK